MRFQIGDQVLWNGEVKVVDKLWGGIVFFGPSNIGDAGGASPELLARHQVPWQKTANGWERCAST